MSEDDQKIEQPIKRERSPSFPYLDLDSSIEYLGRLYAVAKMNEVRQPDVAKAWGMAPKSGSLLRYIAALGQFGLIEAIGGGEQRRIKVSGEGRRILEDDRPGIRAQLKSEAALKSSIIRGLYLGEGEMPRWGSDRPSDSIAESSLKFDLNFGGEAARRFLTVYDATIKHIVDSNAVKEEFHNEDVRVPETESHKPARMDAELKGQQPDPLAANPALGALGKLNDIDYQSAGKGKIKISAVLDADGLDILEKKIAAFKMLID
ncbi:MAG: hypothetical protein Rhims3KO_07230 [Hyphomicrobiales bacterium]